MTGRGGATVVGRHRVVDQLNLEWLEMRDNSSEVLTWSDRHPALAGCASLMDVLAVVQDDPDGVLGALLVESAAGSAVAARTVLQAMLGKVVLMARADPNADLGEYVAAMWERIRTYPIDRRPTHIPANLALDTRKLVRSGRRSDGRAIPWPSGSGFVDVVDRHRMREAVDHNRDVAMMTVGDVIRTALELDLIDVRAGELLSSVYDDGLSSKDAATQHQLTPTTVRWRCSRAVRTLAEHSALLVARS